MFLFFLLTQFAHTYASVNTRAHTRTPYHLCYNTTVTLSRENALRDKRSITAKAFIGRITTPLHLSAAPYYLRINTSSYTLTSIEKERVKSKLTTLESQATDFVCLTLSTH